jgi:hypothetical protein
MVLAEEHYCGAGEAEGGEARGVLRRDFCPVLSDISRAHLVLLADIQSSDPEPPKNTNAIPPSLPENHRPPSKSSVSCSAKRCLSSPIPPSASAGQSRFCDTRDTTLFLCRRGASGHRGIGAFPKKE